MISEAVDFKVLLLDNYKKLNLTETEVTTIFMIDYFIAEGTKFVTAELLSLKMALHTKEIDLILANLLTKGFLEYQADGNKTITSLNPLKEKLMREFQMSMNNDASTDIKTLEKLYDFFTKELSNPISSVEQKIIKDWLNFGFDETTIIDALKEAKSKGKPTLHEVDKILLSWAKREDRESEGQSPLSETWHKNLEETIRIAKTPWLNTDDKENK